MYVFFYTEKEPVSFSGGGGGVLPYLALKGMCEQTPHVRAPWRAYSQARC